MPEKVAQAAFIHYGETRNMLVRGSFRDSTAFLANNHDDFALVIKLVRFRRVEKWSLVADKRFTGSHEDAGVSRHE